MRTVGLFAGIGGLELGLLRAGHETLATCEIDAAAAAVLAARFPGLDNHPDITTLTDLPAGTELLCGGFPCQDLSQAGKTAGIEGSRSGLVGHVFRLLSRRGVPWLVLENVPFMLHLDGGRALGRIVAALEELNYRWAYRVVNRRQRVYLVASLDGDPADVLLADEAALTLSENAIGRLAHGFYWTEGIKGLGWAADAVPTLKNGSTLGIPSPPAVLMPDGGLVKPDIRDAERLQGFPADWTSPAEAVRRPGWRWGLVGNAVSVPVAEWLGRRLREPGHYDRSRDLVPIPRPGWPKAARFDGTTRHEVRISSAPVGVARPHLHEFLEYPGTSLSPRATQGFLGRTRRSGLRFPAGFLDAVEAHLLKIGGHPMRLAAE
ncbi:MAG: DNA (cytosine-5-)-methyltransferase [Alphaproteobacteria bacterium]|nr:DNA (cytosine-5-)-methyltransferase [Alphaproteobacteria bacterium]